MLHCKTDRLANVDIPPADPHETSAGQVYLLASCSNLASSVLLSSCQRVRVNTSSIAWNRCKLASLHSRLLYQLLRRRNATLGLLK